MKKIAIILGGLVFLSNACFSAQPQYAVLNFNLSSISPTITDQQCQALFAEAYYYDSDHDPKKETNKYANSNKNFKIINHEHTGTTYLDSNHYLITTVSTLQFMQDGKSHQAKEYEAFTLDMNTQQIKGSFYIPGYCKGNLIGMDQNNNVWPPRDRGLEKAK